MVGRTRKGGERMSKVKTTMTMSLDGFVAGPSQSAAEPLGVGGMKLHQWLLPLKAFRERHGEEGGEVNASTPVAEEILGNVGATIMGRNMFGGGPGPGGRRSLEGLLGRQSALLPPGLRSHAPSAHAARNGGRND